MNKIRAFMIYIAVTHAVVLADNGGQQDPSNKNGVDAPPQVLQSKYENSNNLTTDELSVNSTNSPEYTTNQKLFVSNITTHGNSITDFTKHGTTMFTTKALELTSNRHGIETTSIRNGIETTSYQTDKKVTSYQTGKKVTSYQTGETVTNNQNGQNVTSNFTNSTTFTTTTKGHTNKITKKQTLITTENPNHMMTSTPSISRLNETSSKLTSISSVSAGSSTVTNKHNTTVFTTVKMSPSLHVADFNSTEEFYNSTVDPSRLVRTIADDFQSLDSFWPIAMALTIGIPTIVVLAVTITVLYRRRMAKPRSLLAMYGQDYSQM